MENLAHSASFHSREETAPSKPGIKHLAMVWAAILAVAVIVLATLQAMRDASLQLKWNQTPVLRSRYVRTTLDTAIAVITVIGMVLLASPAPDIVYTAF